MHTPRFRNQASPLVLVMEILGDGTVEAAETVLLNLTAPVGAAISDGSGRASITNDDQK